MLLRCAAFAKGGEFSRDSVLPSLPLACSKKTPYPPRIAVLPFPFGSKAKPKRGAGLKRCPLMQPGWELLPTAAEGNPGTENGPPGPPHCTSPSYVFAVGDGISAPAVPVILPSGSSVGAVAASYTAGSKLKACFFLSRS